jgi:hypothetical protein
VAVKAQEATPPESKAMAVNTYGHLEAEPKAMA